MYFANAGVKLSDQMSYCGCKLQPREAEKTEQTTCPCKVQLIMRGRELEPLLSVTQSI